MLLEHGFSLSGYLKASEVEFKNDGFPSLVRNKLVIRILEGKFVSRPTSSHFASDVTTLRASNVICSLLRCQAVDNKPATDVKS